jgi:hypothetical protein
MFVRSEAVAIFFLAIPPLFQHAGMTIPRQYGLIEATQS